MALVFRKVESRTTDKFKYIISQLMREIEGLAKSIFDQLDTVTLGKINLILYSLHLEIAKYCPLVSVCILLHSECRGQHQRLTFLIICYSDY